MDRVFSHLASQNRLPRLKPVVAPFHLHPHLEAIERVGLAAERGRAAASWPR
jgi:polyphosphate kinase